MDTLVLTNEALDILEREYTTVNNTLQTIFSNSPILEFAERKDSVTDAVVDIHKLVVATRDMRTIIRDHYAKQENDALVNELQFRFPKHTDGTFNDYFYDTVEYPTNVVGEILPINTLWSYISNSFLEGFINYVNIDCAYVLGRYQDWDAEFDEPIVLHGAHPEQKSCTTKSEVFEFITTVKQCHTKIWSFQDDVVLLSRARHDPSIYLYFWFDCDVSDCCIGRFQTHDTHEQVVEKFKKHVEDLDFDYPSRELPVSCFTGWIS